MRGGSTRWHRRGAEDASPCLSRRDQTVQMREQSIGTCNHCSASFSYYLVHNGFNNSQYAYCDSCGMVAVLNVLSKQFPLAPTDRLMTGHLQPELETKLRPCDCGGSFTVDAVPRCPSCRMPLSAESATTYIEKNAPGTEKGWQWQGSWSGIYCIVIDNRTVTDNFA